MSMERPQVLVVGAGGYGRVYVDALLREDLGADLAGVCDLAPDLEERIPALRERKIPVYRDLADFYAREGADLAVLASPVHFHRDMTLYCLAHGSHVLCEKPLCLTLAEAEEMAEAARAAGKFLALGYQLDYRRDVLALKRDILAGRYGAPLRLGVCHGFRRGERYYARNDWAGKVSVRGREVLDSPFANACAHNFQMMTFLLGDGLRTACDVTGLEAELYRGNPRVENFDIAALRFATDCGAELMYFTAHPILPDALGPRGVFEFEEGTVTFAGEAHAFRARMKDGRQVDYGSIDPGQPLQKLLDAIQAVREGGAPVCGAEADRGHIRAVRLAQACPVAAVREELRVSYEEGGQRYLRVEGLEKLLEDCLDAWALPAQLGRRLD